MFFLKESLNVYVGLTWFANMTGRSLRCIVFDLAGGLLGFTLYELCLCVSGRLLVVGFCVVTVVGCGVVVVVVVVVGAFVVGFSVVLEGVVIFCVVDVVVVSGDGCEVVGFVEDSVEGTAALVTVTGFSVFAGVKGE